MWVRKNNGVFNLETGQQLVVQRITDGQGVSTWDLRSVHPQHSRGTAQVLQAGYRSENEAKAALDALLSDLNVKPVEAARPTTDEETDTTEVDNTVDEKS